ncbi:sterol desaturase family protein [Vibrio breoganii]|uniref:sterol desaturase family protein n=1 Tax=Vibrio breoganii TaxID=553239 RepID=UPI000C858A94|nr:sterol desaturase family protein [Vibrio breoganii]PML54460.1 sterol desaturase [Vibrio breoganii]PMO83459.1 sterol desaturase [Vibrio breoganii]
MDVASIRLSIFIAVLCICALIEALKPKRPLTQPKGFRWLNNLGLTGFNSIVLMITMPLLAVEAALWAEQNQVGLLYWLFVPLPIATVVAVIALDCAIYWQHRLFHTIPVLWSLHKVHHADQDIDVTTGARFHPIEIWLSMWIKIGIVIALGVPPVAVIIFEIVLNASAMFNHSNMRLPLSLDKVLRKWLVTPDMHRVHHSTIRQETDSNYGFCLSIWDRLFGSYIKQPKLGHQGMNIGIGVFREPKEQRIDKMLTQPFRNN